MKLRQRKQPLAPAALSPHISSVRLWKESFETRFDIEEQIAEGDRVATRVTMHAVHNHAEFMGVPPQAA